MSNKPSRNYNKINKKNKKQMRNKSQFRIN